jgi:hypothetical protein
VTATITRSRWEAGHEIHRRKIEGRGETDQAGEEKEGKGEEVSKFLTDLDVKCINDGAWELDSTLCYESDRLGLVKVPLGFQTDFASVPRLPVFFTLFGDRAHREAVLHDYLYRSDSIPVALRFQADNLFLEAMTERGKGFFVRYAMYWGVRLGGWTAYHKKKVRDPL